MIRIFVFLLALALSYSAQAQSTIDPTQPASSSALSSAPIRGNFQAAYNDLNRLFAYTGGTAPFTVPIVVMLNTGTPQPGQAGVAVQIVGAPATNARFEADTYAAAGRFTCVRSNGTLAVQTALTTNDEICSYNSFGHNGTNLTNAQARMSYFAAQPWTPTALGTFIRLSVTPNNSTVLTDAIGIENDGGITVPPTVTGGSKGAGTINAAGLFSSGQIRSASNSAGVGYAAGAGCSITQSGTRSAGVSCTGTTGQITGNNTSLAAGNEATFTVTNTSVAINDTVQLSVQSGPTAGTSVFFVSRVAANAFDIRIRNLSGATADTGAPIINFTVTKGSAS